MTLFILPNLLHPKGKHPHELEGIVPQLDGLIAESVQAGRSFLGRFRTKKPPYQIPIALLNEHTRKDEIDFFLKPIQEGQTWGLISDAGLPCIADPGSELVFRARLLNLPIIAIVGPSAVVLTLQLCGFHSQSFVFHGYLPSDPRGREAAIRKLAKGLHLFIEAPYRNMHLLQALIRLLPEEAFLCIAVDLTAPTEEVITKKIAKWRKDPLPQLEKRPTVFAIFISRAYNL